VLERADAGKLRPKTVEYADAAWKIDFDLDDKKFSAIREEDAAGNVTWTINKMK
jgi:hypothetical protein